MLRDWRTSDWQQRFPAQQADQVSRIDTYQVKRRSAAFALCSSLSCRTSSRTSVGQVNCSSSPEAISQAGIRVLIGVYSVPDALSRRAGIRKTWMRWQDLDGERALVCFVIGQRMLSKAELKSLDAEARAYGDMVFLVGTSDVKNPMATISKMVHWWRLAVKMLGGRRSIPFIAKVDDDTFVNLPRLQADLCSLHCISALYYGSIAFTGENPHPRWVS